ncbi:hypothetical protein [Asticcacaulis excentricus]|uniref:Uncharacterized protein n=1 Tax=Asticcacaulis excentricus (strain ATCC 15261 / DSM 4724 / KCTC 12464 / NCIMB 9791 / VKM B-1370 / CB 48) TaxID=573065 RepID=E8RP57_ASTEC|nr:hypothetical protein [Asticcacaulis excentricus]ADU13027.1 hypothetical protein Astex_1357 [Asticcacaulis excentricus CB 48]
MGQLTDKDRLIFMAHSDLRVIVLRPVGALPPEVLIEQFFLSLKRVEGPWLYHRLVDMRRYDRDFSSEHVTNLAKRWQGLRGRHKCYAHVALVCASRCERWHQAGPLPGFPNETLCRFTSYSHAFNWLTAKDRHAYLLQIADAQTDQARKSRPSSFSSDLVLD